MKILSIAALLIILTGVLSANFISAVEKIDINSAPLEDLVKIIHIGEVRAKELISLRPFSSLDDLARIKGIGDSRVNDIKKQGLAWVDESYNKKTEPTQTIKAPPPAEEPREALPGELAAVSEPIRQAQDEQTHGSLLPFLAALAVAIFSVAIILVLKNKVKIG